MTTTYDMEGAASHSMGYSVYDNNNQSTSSSTPSQSVVSFITGQFGKRHDDLKTMLDSSNNGQKLDAMKRIVAMLASGKDVSELFPAVVKNVVSKNIEVKKLVYVYLVRYAEEQQDLALLSIATFQRGLKDPNQLIRASALRVLSSIRVPVIVPIMMLSLKEAVTDMSPYVRKTAANAISKLYGLDPSQKEPLVEIIEKLLQDKTTLVAGSTVIAFEVVCPERIDLIHRNYRKLCNMLIDIDEWGQVAVINMLLRYARTQFLDPNLLHSTNTEEDKKFYPSSQSDDSGTNDEEEPRKMNAMDSDHRLLLKSCQPLLQSRNSAVIMSVAKVYHHIAPNSEVGIVVKALVRLLRSHREVQSIVLSNIITMSLQKKGLFESYLKTFFVHTDDPTHIKKLKLEIITNLANESNIPLILRELQTYISCSDKDFAASTIQSIGRCASNIPEVADTCLAGLIRMLSNRDENVVSESIIVIKKLLQMRQKDHSEVITHMAKLLEKVHVPMARASIIWLIGEYADRIPKIAPDVLRKMAKSFTTEEDIVKLQIINLSAKLYITNSKQTRSLCQYVLQMSKYDQNYDIRDRARFIKFILFPADKTDGGSNNLKKKAKKIFLVEKPAPVLQSLFKDRGQYQLGSLSHMIDAKAAGYQDLPDFPEEQPDPTVRNVEMQPVYGNQFLLTKEKRNGETDCKGAFYSSSEDEDEESDAEESDSSDDEDSQESSAENDEESAEESEFEELSESEEDGDDDDDAEVDAKKKVAVVVQECKEESFEEETGSSDEESEDTSEGESDGDVKTNSPKHTKVDKIIKNSMRPNQSSYDQLLDLDDCQSTASSYNNVAAITPSLVSDMESLSMNASSYVGHVQPNTPTTSMPSYELLSKINGKGLVVSYRFTRAPCVFSRSMVSIEVEFVNKSNNDVKKIRVEDKKLSSGAIMQEFNEILCIAAGESLYVNIGVDFKDTMQPVNFRLCTETDRFPVIIKVPVGELTKGVTLTQADFTAQQMKLTGMTESTLGCELPPTLHLKTIQEKILEVANMTICSSTTENTLRFASILVSSELPVLLSIKQDGASSVVIVNSEKISVASLLAKEIKSTLIKL